MTILAFWRVGCPGDGQPERHTFDEVSDETAFRELYMNKEKWDVCFYDMESHYGNKDTYGIGSFAMGDADDFEEDYNNEELDGGHWVKAMHVPSKFVGQIIDEYYRTR